MKFADRVSVGKTKITADGYLVATARVARTGVQQYLASELGDTVIAAGFAPGDVVRVYRHPDEVFSDASLRTVTRLPVTVGHPDEAVTAGNWAKYSVGDVGDTYLKEDEWIVVNPMIKDARGVKAASDTHREISMGYTAEIVPARDGIDADFEQRNIRYNHLALVKAARAGSKARIGDEWGVAPLNDNEPPGGVPITTRKGGRMPDTTMKTVVLGDKAVQVSASDEAVIEQFKSHSVKQLADAHAAHDAAMAAKDTEMAKLQAALDDAKSKILDDAAIDARVSARSALIAQATAIAPGIKATGLSDAQIRRAVVQAKIGDAAIADKSDVYVDARFDILAEGAGTNQAKNPLAEALADGAVSVGDAEKVAQDAFNKSVNDLNAWRNK